MGKVTIYTFLLVILSACHPTSSPIPASSWEELPVVAERMEANGHPFIVCHLEKLTDSIRIPLSQLVEDLEIIPLENKDEAYVRNTSIRISENYILLHSSRNMPFKLFTRKGKFVCNIGSVSHLPGGYTQVYDFQLDEVHNRIYLMPWNATELIVYDLQGRLQPSIPLNSPNEETWKLPKSVFHVDGDKQELIATAAKTLVDSCGSEYFAVSFTGSADFSLPEGRSRLYIRSSAAAEAPQIAEATGLEDPAIRLVFLTENHDTRFEEYSVLRPLSAAH